MLSFSIQSSLEKWTASESDDLHTEPEMQAVGWEPFAPLKTYSFTIVPNWVPFYVNAQFRDEYGNLSPVYCDDFHVEGWCYTPPP
jgi:hypothetical protein